MDEIYDVLADTFKCRLEDNKYIRKLSFLVSLVCDEMNVSESQDILVAASLHDIGKIAVPDNILNKPFSLTDDEWNVLKEHPVIGQKIVSCFPAFVSAGLIIRSTHEWYDGSGYPDGLKGEMIPLGSRIISVCDAFSAIVSERPFCAARSARNAIEELCLGAGSQFDPEVIAAFSRAVEKQNSLLLVSFGC